MQPQISSVPLPAARPALQLVANPSSPEKRSLSCRWRFDPEARRLVATWVAE
jgi:hypothetical protein